MSCNFLGNIHKSILYLGMSTVSACIVCFLNPLFNCKKNASSSKHHNLFQAIFTLLHYKQAMILWIYTYILYHISSYITCLCIYIYIYIWSKQRHWWVCGISSASMCLPRYVIHRCFITSTHALESNMVPWPNEEKTGGWNVATWSSWQQSEQYLSTPAWLVYQRKTYYPPVFIGIIG